MADVTPIAMQKRMDEWASELSTTGMNAACQAGLRPARARAKKRNFGFTDRRPFTRRQLGKVRRYKRRSVRRHKGGGAYFRGGSLVGAVLEYRYSRKYSWIIRALNETRSSQLSRFAARARVESTKAAAKARNRFA